MGRLERGFAVAGAAAMIGLVAASTQPAPPFERPTRPAETGARDAQPGDPASRTRLREGSEFDSLRGSFRVAENRILFFPSQGGSRYIALENLNLERIACEIESNPTQLEWAISGTVTEFRSTNYLLIRRAILARNTSPSDSEPQAAPHQRAMR